MVPFFRDFLVVLGGMAVGGGGLSQVLRLQPLRNCMGEGGYTIMDDVLNEFS